MQGWQFAAELSRLRIVGRVDLPALSSTFAAMNRAVAGTAAGEIWEIGQKTYKALDGLDAWCPGANASKSVALLTISGAIAAVIFAGATAGAGGAAFAAAVGVEGLQSLATTLSNTGPLQSKKVDIGGLTVPPIITGMQNAMTELTKSIDAQQQELAGGLTKFTQDVHANWNRILVPGPREMNDVRNADGASLKASDTFRVR